MQQAINDYRLPIAWSHKRLKFSPRWDQEKDQVQVCKYGKKIGSRLDSLHVAERKAEKYGEEPKNLSRVSEMIKSLYYAST